MSKARRTHQWQKCPRYAVVLRLGYINPKRKKAHYKVYKTIRKQLTAPETVKWSTVPRDDGSRKKFPATAARRNDSNENSSAVAAASVHPTVGAFPDDVQYPQKFTALKPKRRRRDWDGGVAPQRRQDGSSPRNDSTRSRTVPDGSRIEWDSTQLTDQFKRFSLVPDRLPNNRPQSNKSYCRQTV